MSRENVEVVRTIYERWRRGDFSVTDWADPDLEFASPYNSPEEGLLRGLEAMRGSWRGFLSAWTDFRAEPEEIIDAGEHVLVLTEFGGTGRESGVPVERMRGASLFTFRGGRVVRLVLYTDRARALEAAGLRDGD